MSRIHTHYDNLKVSRKAPPEVIKAAYKTLAQRYHPDKNPGDPEAAKITVFLNASYEVLMDPEKRRRHDEWISAQECLSTGEDTSRHSQRVPSPSPKPETYVQHSLMDVAKAYPFFATLLMMFGLFILLKSVLGDTAGDDAPNRPPLVTTAGPIESSLQVESKKMVAAETYTPSTSQKFHPPKASQWKKLNAQMSVRDVEKLLGPPKSTANDGDLLVLFYSDMRHAGPYITIKNGHPYFWIGSPSATTAKVANPPVNRIATGNCQASDHQMLPPNSFNGYIPGTRVTRTDGLSTFTVDNTQVSQDVLVKLVGVGDSFAARTFQVKGKSRFTAKDLTPGRYRLMYRHRDSCKSTLADDIFALKEEEVDGGTQYSNIRVTLYEVQNGNLNMRDIDSSEFDSY